MISLHILYICGGLEIERELNSTISRASPVSYRESYRVYTSWVGLGICRA